MKLISARLLLLLIVSVMGCRDTIAPNESQSISSYTTDLKQARKWFAGRWQLIAVTASIHNPAVADVQLVISNNQIAVVRDGQQIDNVTFDIEQTSYGLLLKTSAQPKQDNWYVRNPTLQIARNRLFLDTGIAQDLPGFTFVRIN